MLGWEVLVFRSPEARKEDLVARWRTGPSGLAWLDQLVIAGYATELGGGGYPTGYTVEADKLLPMLTKGLPLGNGPLVIGDDYVLASTWSSAIEWCPANVIACQPSDRLLVEAWDQS